jgi:hypothetical protein
MEVVAEAARPSVTSLKDASFFAIVEQVHTYSPAALSLLPARVRRKMLRFLPAAELWRLERCRDFVEGLDMGAVWSDRLKTHISDWVYPEDVDEVKQEDNEGPSAREVYLFNVTHVLLSMTADRLEHLDFQTHVSHSDMYERTAYVQRTGRFRLPRALQGNTEKLVNKNDYVDLLFYGVFMKNVPLLYKVASCHFHPEYNIPLLKGARHSGCVCMERATRQKYTLSPMCVQCFQRMVGYLVDNTDWRPKTLSICSPSQGFVKSVEKRNDTVLKFLRSVEEIKVVITSLASYFNMVRVLRGVFQPQAGLSPTSLIIKQKNSLEGDASCSAVSGVVVSLLETRPGLRLVELTNCSLKTSDMESLVSVFLSTATSCTRTLNIRQGARHFQVGRQFQGARQFQGGCLFQESLPLNRTHTLPPLCNQKLFKPLKISQQVATASEESCQNGENKVLCLPFLPSLLQWLLAFPGLSLHHLELTVPDSLCDEYLPQIYEILTRSSDSIPSPFPITVTVECKTPSVTESKCAGVIFDLAMCHHIYEVRLMKCRCKPYVFFDCV